MTEKVLVSLIEEVLEERKKKKAGKKDACYHKVKSRYKKWPSAYGSGALAKCRKVSAENWGNSTNEELALDEEELFEILLDEEDETLEEKKRKLTKKPSSETSLRDWFARKGEPGKGGGWVDCNSPIRKDGKKTGYKSCGRSGKDDKRSKYPACRPTPSACKSKGKGKSWGKKSAKGMKESMNNLQEQIENEILSLLNEAKEEDVKELIRLSNQENHEAFFDESGDVKPEKKEEYDLEVKKYHSQLSNIPKQYLSWVQIMSNGDPEPLDEIISMLKAYLQNKGKFQGTKLNKDLTPGLIRQKLEKLGGDSDQKSSGKIPLGNDVIYKSENWIGVYPKTEEGSVGVCKNLSSGVQWCTAATKTKNYFNEYTGEYNIHLYYFFKKGGNTRKEANDAIAIGWVKKDGKPEIIHGRNATVNAANTNLSELDLKEIFGEEWGDVKNKMFNDLQKEERKETAYNKMISNLTPETLNAQLEAIGDPGKQEEALYDLLRNETFVQNKETANFAILKLSKLSKDLYLSYTPIATLPDNLTVGGDLDLSDTSITTLPDNLKIYGNLNLSYTPIATLPDNLTVDGSLNLSDTSITTLPDNLTVGGDLDLSNTRVTILPNNLTVGGYLNLSDTLITTLPDNLKIDGILYLSNSEITTLPDNLKVGGGLSLSNSEITTLPDNLTVGGDLNLYNSKIITLPGNLTVGGNLLLHKSEITTLPDNLKIGGNIYGPDGRMIKKTTKGISESMNNLQKLIESEVLSLLNEANDEKLVKMKSLDFLLLTRMEPSDEEKNPELKQKLKDLGLDNLGLDKLTWVNPANLGKNYNEYINNDPLFLEFKKEEDGRYKVVQHEGRHRNLGNLLANGKDAKMNVVLKGDIPPSETNVQRQGMEGSVELKYDEETSNEKPPENLDDHLNREIDLSNLFTIIKKIALDDIKKNKGEDEAALFSKSFGEFIKTFNENYGIKLKDLKGNEEFYELEVGGSFIKKLQLRDSAGANHGRSLNTTEGANVDENEAGSASNYTGTPYRATLVKKNISEGGAMNNLQEQILTEVMQLLESTNISEGMQYHLDNKIPITETIYRPLSDGFMRLMKEARTLHSLGLYEGLTEDEREILESDLGEVGVYEGQEVPLDLLMVEEEELDEAKYKGKDVKLNKPQRGGSKKFYVYVRDPKSGNIRKVSFGARGMSVKLNDPKRRKAFVDRHRCKEKKNKTTAGYWACRIGRYPHLFGGNTKYTWW